MYTEPPAPAAGVHCHQEPFGLHLSVSASRFATYYPFPVDLGIRFSPSTATIIVIKQASPDQYKSCIAAQSHSRGYSFFSIRSVYSTANVPEFTRVSSAFTLQSHTQYST